MGRSSSSYVSRDNILDNRAVDSHPSVPCWDVLPVQVVGNHLLALDFQVVLEDLPDDLGLLTLHL